MSEIKNFPPSQDNKRGMSEGEAMLEEALAAGYVVVNEYDLDKEVEPTRFSRGKFFYPFDSEYERMKERGLKVHYVDLPERNKRILLEKKNAKK